MKAALCQAVLRLGILAAVALAGAAQLQQGPVQPQDPNPTNDPNVHSPWRKQLSSLISFRGNQPVEPQFCVIVRTYWGHSGGQEHGLRRLIRSLRRQTVQRWEAIFLVMDDKPFLDLHHILAEYKDERLWVFAEWVGPQFMPKKDKEWMPGYHGMLYNLTDDAVQVCPKDTRWLVITNGDNEYADTFMQKVVEAGDTDIVAFDFYSRFQRPTAPPCDRFTWYTDRPACKRNRLKWCHTDLGANVLNYPKFVTEQRRFGYLQSEMGLQEDHFDGLMAQALVQGGWRTVHYHDQCLFNHAPSPQWCAWQNGVWDDSDIVNWNSAGGRCIGYEERNSMLANDPELEEVFITLSNDGNVTAFEGTDLSQMQIRCLRKRDYYESHVKALYWFSSLCADDADMPAFTEMVTQYEAAIAQQNAAAQAQLLADDLLTDEANRIEVPAEIPGPPPRDGSGGQPEYRKRYEPTAEEQLLQQQQQQQLVTGMQA